MELSVEVIQAIGNYIVGPICAAVGFVAFMWMICKSNKRS